MARKQPKNQLLLDYSVRGNRIVLHLGQVESQRIADHLFEGLVNGDWMIEPAGEVADISYAQDIVHQIGHKLPYPDGIKIAQLHNVDPLFKGFSAIYHQKGWVFVNAASDINERNYHIHLLTVSLGLHTIYANTASLAARSEQLIFEALLPFEEVESFFRNDISKIPEFLASDIANFFKVPFPMVLKRALNLKIITDDQYRSFMTVNPSAAAKPRELFFSKDGSIDDLEAQLFSGE
ncbi:hypothetical protein J2Y45_000803 [Dyadobacter sp. BE34]|uniref:Uncharacterized protein n=1 Tax=Dyadobacter fermentans TaxID=94254 RepID=A0ABU1QQU8_9BACT|nr:MULTISPECIES: hypothetical protein [Dyadobacter]MBZ1358851.1 hypothetical protein [Dyadobacter fermentans]MDR6803533.1 hypothetical protein [Dyadobacter fermentans]MDR7041274.1 hypothetical protein [Dyadobacter sp. BE242]MDR7195677.1 hypothetical protein [Dyadobacter sp. BE34]MDR7213778.1 hypothetical protein [Dyadobacter sp. BE31]